MRYIIAIVLSVFLMSCYEQKPQGLVKDVSEPKQVIIYCENAMLPPLMEMKGKFEAEFNCKIKLHNDCSQNLSSLIQYALVGDIYLPASRDGFSKLKTSYITDSVFLGYNTLVVMALKGDPSGYNGELKTLADKKHAVIISNPETSSLGYETRKVLDREHLYNDIKLNVVALSTDSRGLVNSLEDKETQLVINWKSNVINNDDIIEVFSIPESEASPAEIYAGLLSTSHHKDLAKKFLAYAKSKEGVRVFRKYGFMRRKSFVF